MIHKRAPRWQSAAERAQVAAELMEEAESLTGTGIATPAEVKRSRLPPPLSVAFTLGPAALAEPPDGAPAVATPSASSAPPLPLLAAPAPASLPPHMAAREKAARGDRDGALAVLDAALAAAPDDALLRLERAAMHSASGCYGASRRDLERVLQADPAHVEALTNLGVLLARRGLWIEAVPHLKRAVELRPGYAGAWYQLGESLNHVDHLSEACAAYERAVELEPRNTRALYGLGIVLDRLKRPEDATHMYRRSREAAGR
jgi:tetratricopeptide (TPR) repeat protein